MRMLHVKGWGWLEGDTKWTPESPAKMDPREDLSTLLPPPTQFCQFDMGRTGRGDNYEILIIVSKCPNSPLIMPEFIADAFRNILVT